MIHFSRLFALGALLAAGTGAALAQTPNPQDYTPPSTLRPPENGDISANPSTAEQINRAMQDKVAANARGTEKGKVKTRPATTAEIAIGSEVRDKKGKPVGSVQGVDPDGAVVVTAAGKVKVPLEAFGMDGTGLVIAITKAEFDQLVASATASPAG